MPIYTEKQDIKSFTFNLKSLGQGLNNRDSPLVRNQTTTNSSILNNQFNQMENLLNNWYLSNLLKVQTKNDQEIDEQQQLPNTSDKVKHLIAFLKENGFFNTSKLTQNEIDEQMLMLMKLLEEKLKQTQAGNKNGKNGNQLNAKSNSNLIDLTTSNRIDEEFKEIDEKMKQNLNFLEEIEQKTTQNHNNNVKRSNFKNLKITSKVSIDDEFHDASDLISNHHEPVHNVNIKLDRTPVAEATANLKKEKGKIKIIKRKIYRNNDLSEQKSFEKVAYVNSMEEADLINLDDDLNNQTIVLNKANVATNLEQSKEIKNSFNYINDKDYDEKQINLNKDAKLLIDDDIEKQLNQLNPNFGYARYG